MPPLNQTHAPTYYEILSLPPSTLTNLTEPETTALIKRAYRRALLNHHPDKKNPGNTTTTTSSTSNTTTKTFTIDQISTAYATLSRPAQRQAYDRSLALTRQQLSPSSSSAFPEGGIREFQTGIETVDLDDLDCEEYYYSNSTTNGADTDGNGDGTETRWFRSCRCGNPRGYQFTEADLEDAADLGELMVGCADCSLWLRVHFAVVDDDESGVEDGRRDGQGDEDGVKQQSGAQKGVGLGDDNGPEGR